MTTVITLCTSQSDGGPRERELTMATGTETELAIRMVDVSRTFTTPKSAFTAIKDVSLDVTRGEFLSVVGPSGCGKSTLLTLLAGLSTPSTGTVETFGCPVTGVTRAVGFIFQRDALLPWRSALQNVAIPLRF